MNAKVLQDSASASLRKLKRLIPVSARPFITGALAKLGFPHLKYWYEVNYWRDRFVEGSWIVDDYYEERFLKMADEPNQDFLAGKVVVDFGCGPRGSLCWANRARVRVGVDVLADAYSEFDISEQHMTYVVCSERKIPLPSNYVDILMTMNALDHVSHLPAICHELARILKTGGTLIGAFNLHEPQTHSEPQILTEEKLDRLLLDAFVPSRREIVQVGTTPVLWFRGTKRVKI